MKFFCSASSLLAAAQGVSAAVPTRHVKPVLANFLAEAPDGGPLTLSATDLELGVRYTLQGAQVQQGGSLLLPAAQLLDILRELRSAEVSLEGDGSGTHLVAGLDAEFDLPGEDASLFPAVPEFPADLGSQGIAAGVLRGLVQRTLFACADGETARYAMTGLLWELNPDDNEVRLVGTDGRRLATDCGPCVELAGGNPRTSANRLVPRKAMGLVARLLSGLDDGEECRVRFPEANTEVLLRLGPAVVYSRLVEGRFPDWKQVMPKKCAGTARITVEALHGAVSRAAIMTDRDARRILLTFDPAGTLSLRAAGAMTGKASVRVGCQYSGEKAVELSVNPDYLVGYLRQLPHTDEVEIDLADGATPMVLRWGMSSRALIMPLT